ncbi:MAG: DUF4340 domain-containing protein [Candidatus Hydrogenedens sp.]|nr:DUF4340 domain-containing protein [Candidatus Hydrogenedens sp.]
MKAKTLIPFVVVLAVLGGLIALRVSQKEEVSMRDQAGLERVVPDSISSDSVKRIELYAGGTPDDKVELKRSGDAWVVTSLHNAPAKQEIIDTFLEKLEGIQGEPRDKADTDERLAEYQLKDDEAFRVRAFTSDEGDEPALDLLFGKAPTVKTVFFRKAGESQVYVESANLRQEAGVSGDDMTVAPKPDRWLDKEIIKLDDTKITKLAYTMPDKSWVLERQEIPAEEPAADTPEEGEATPPAPAEPKYEWKATSGGIEGEAVLQTGIDRIMGRLRSYQASTVADPEKKAEYGLDNPPFKLVVSREDGDDVTFLGARPDTSSQGVGHIMQEGADPEIIYEVSRFNFEYVFLKASDLYTLPALELDKTAINKLEINHATGGRAVLEKQGDQWAVTEPATGIEMDQTKVDGLLNAVASLKMQDYADNAPAAFDSSITVYAGDTTRTVKADGQSPVIDGRYVQLDGDPRTYAINGFDYDAIFIDPGSLYNLDAIAFGVDDISSVQMQHEGKSVNLERGDEGWTVSVDGGAGFPGEEGRVKRLTDALDQLSMDGIYAGSLTPEWEPFMTLAVKAADGRAHTLNVGPADGEIHPVRLDGRETMFKVTTDTANLLKYHFNSVQYQPEPEAPAEAAPAADAAQEAPAAEEAAAPAEAPAAADVAPVVIDVPAPEATEAPAAAE